MKRSIRNSLTAFAILATVAAATTGCGAKKKQAEEDAEPVKVPVKTVEAYTADIENTVQLTSNILPFKENNIAPSMPERIAGIYVDVGARVSRGQLLVRMDPTQFNQINVQYANTKADYDRIKTVYEAGGVSKQDMDQIAMKLSVEREQYNNLKTNIELRSPIDGVVTARNYDPGDMYGAQPILTIMQINTLKVTAAVSEQYFPYVKKNMPAEIRVDMYPDRAFEGKVSLIHPAIDATTRTFTVEISIPNPKSELRPGMFARTQLHFGSTPGIVVEDIAVQTLIGSNEKYLFVAVDGKAERRSVKTGRADDKKIEILSGVAEGEAVIVAGIQKLIDGTEIEIKND